MKFTGERVVPDQMQNDVLTLTQHLTRYNFALKYCAGKKVLDAACGTGYGMNIMSFVASDVIGLDISYEAIEYAKANYKFSNKPNSFFTVNLSETNFAVVPFKNNIDVITSFETIEHLENPDFFLKNVKDSLVDDGLFIFSIPNTNPSAFHKQIYDLVGAKKLIGKYFKNVEWFGQDNVDIGECAPYKNFFIGVAKK